MNSDDLKMQIEENVLKFMLNPRFKKDIEDAKEYFDHDFGELETSDEMTIDFNSWLIYDFKMKDGKTFIEKYFKIMENQLSKEEREFIQRRMKSFLSLYVLKEKKEDKGLFKDLFTKVEYWINLDQIEEIKINDLILARIIEIEDGYNLVENEAYVPAVFKNAIERSMVTQYEVYKEKNQYANWEEFLKKNSLLLHKYLGIITDVTHEVEDEEDYNVWQSIYLIKNIKDAKQALLKHEEISLDDEEDGSYYFKLFSNDELIAEIVLENNRIELECTSENDRKKSKKMIESILGDLAKHYKDDIVGIDDII